MRALEEDEALRATLLANQLDVQWAAQEALDQHERIRDALGDDALEAGIRLAEQQTRASLEATRLAQITAQLDAFDRRR